MIEGFRLSKIANVDCSVTQMYDYIKLEFSIGMPYRLVFCVEVTPKDIDALIVLLQKAKSELRVKEKVNEAKT